MEWSESDFLAVLAADQQILPSVRSSLPFIPPSRERRTRRVLLTDSSCSCLSELFEPAFVLDVAEVVCRFRASTLRERHLERPPLGNNVGDLILRVGGVSR